VGTFTVLGISVAWLGGLHEAPAAQHVLLYGVVSGEPDNILHCAVLVNTDGDSMCCLQFEMIVESRLGQRVLVFCAVLVLCW
jgi:hypothetical protein